MRMVHDELRKIYGRTAEAKRLGCKAGDFSYNTGSLRCPVCDGTGTISLDVQFLPDVDIPCPECRGSRYGKQAKLIRYTNKDGEERSLPELMNMDVNAARITAATWVRSDPSWKFFAIWDWAI